MDGIATGIIVVLLQTTVAAGADLLTEEAGASLA